MTWSPWVFFSFLLDISCIKHVVTYSIITFVIGIVSKTMIKCLYASGKLWSKVMTTFSLFTSIQRRKLIHECLNIECLKDPWKANNISKGWTSKGWIISIEFVNVSSTITLNLHSQFGEIMFYHSNQLFVSDYI